MTPLDPNRRYDASSAALLLSACYTNKICKMMMKQIVTRSIGQWQLAQAGFSGESVVAEEDAIP